MTTTSTSRRSSGSGVSSERVLEAAGVRIVASVVADGDFHPGEVPTDVLARRQRALVDLPWTMLDQRHGAEVVEVAEPGGAVGAVGDVAVTGCVDAVLGCWVGDCAPIVLIGAERFAVAHAGWRGLAAGVIEAALAAVREPIAAVVLGPTIGPCCYEFGPAELAAVASGLGVDPASIRGATSWGAPALDVPAAVAAALAPVGATPIVIGACTGCAYAGFSHRVRAERGRHVVAAWRPSR